ncbi:hypothetical protein PSTT_10800 [Puccinia striiformis]|uniref:Uncharacterized protein n=1 Tax=Puccinia striiformis TaxID=27350 RepID=A0A2S4V2V6_9BASI|nr:hypothetical protein PSTT_10800 [Puccinia striiformis]
MYTSKNETNGIIGELIHAKDSFWRKTTSILYSFARILSNTKAQLSSSKMCKFILKSIWQFFTNCKAKIQHCNTNKSFPILMALVLSLRTQMRRTHSKAKACISAKQNKTGWLCIRRLATLTYPTSTIGFWWQSRHLPMPARGHNKYLQTLNDLELKVLQETPNREFLDPGTFQPGLSGTISHWLS